MTAQAAAPAAPRRRHDLTGATFGVFEVWGSIGEGGMSRVWLARHRALSVPVILKTLRSEDDPEAATRLLNEARLMARLVTPAHEVMPVFERWAAGRATIEQGVTVPPMRLRSIGGFPTSVAAFATDLPSLTNWGTPYLVGPGSVHVAHTDDEHLSIAELERAVDAYVRLATVAIEGA